MKYLFMIISLLFAMPANASEIQITNLKCKSLLKESDRLACQIDSDKQIKFACWYNNWPESYCRMIKYIYEGYANDYIEKSLKDTKPPGPGGSMEIPELPGVKGNPPGETALDKYYKNGDPLEDPNHPYNVQRLAACNNNRSFFEVLMGIQCKLVPSGKKGDPMK